MEPYSIHQRVTDQFAPTAASYASSGVHANASELAKLVSLAEPKQTDVAIDVATGAGHMALALAPHVAKVVAFDLTRSMLDQTAQTAEERGLSNIDPVEGAAESLPFENDSFDIYTVRLAPHHFADVRGSILEAYRVLRPGGRYLVVDTSAPEENELDRQVNEIEVLRDPSHVRNYKSSEWQAMVTEAGFELLQVEEGLCRELEFVEWVRRQNATEERVVQLRNLLSTASEDLRRVLELSESDSTFFFKLPQVTLLARKPG